MVRCKVHRFFGSQAHWKTSYGKFTLRTNDELHTYETPLSAGLPGKDAFIEIIPLLGVDENGTKRELLEAKFYNEERELLYTYSP